MKQGGCLMSKKVNKLTELQSESEIVFTKMTA